MARKDKAKALQLSATGCWGYFQRAAQAAGPCRGRWGPLGSGGSHAWLRAGGGSIWGWTASAGQASKPVGAGRGVGGWIKRLEDRRGCPELLPAGTGCRLLLCREGFTDFCYETSLVCVCVCVLCKRLQRVGPLLRPAFSTLLRARGPFAPSHHPVRWAAGRLLTPGGQSILASWGFPFFRLGGASSQEESSFKARGPVVHPLLGPWRKGGRMAVQKGVGGPSGQPRRPHPPPARSCLPGRGKSFRLKLPALLALAGSKQSLPQDDPDEEAVVVDLSKQSSESVALDEVPSSLDNHCLGGEQPGDQRALMERGGEGSKDPPATHSSPRADRAHLRLEASFSNCSLARSRSRESFYSVRRASSVDDIEAMRGEGDKGWAHGRHASTGGCAHHGVAGQWPQSTVWPGGGVAGRVPGGLEGGSGLLTLGSPLLGGGASPTEEGDCPLGSLRVPSAGPA